MNPLHSRKVNRIAVSPLYINSSQPLVLTIKNPGLKIRFRGVEGKKSPASFSIREACPQKEKLLRVEDEV